MNAPRLSLPASCYLTIWTATAAISALLGAAPAQAAVTLPKVFGNDMVLQSGEPLNFWGWADVGEKVTLKQAGVVLAVAEGKGSATPWKVQLPAQKAGPVPDLEISGSNTLTLSNILAGEVWLCSGQSNMVMTVQKGPWCGYGGVLDADKETAAATDGTIRLFQAGKGWRVCSPETVPEFSGTAYFFARHLRAELKSPVGVLLAVAGGTAAERWTPARVLESDASFQSLKLKAKTLNEDPRLAEDRKAMEAWKKEVEAAKSAGTQAPAAPKLQLTPEQNFAAQDSAPVLTTGSLYENNIRPLAPFNIKGAVWYQGESNARRGELYASLMGHLIGGWREDWGTPFPFVVVTLAGFGKPEPWTPNQGSYALMREAQIQVARDVPGVGVVSATDVGEASNIHPPNKQAVGARAALWALNHVYKRNTVSEGPVFGEVTFSPGKAVVPVLKSGDGLHLKGPGGFELAGIDHNFVPATAELKGSEIEVRALGVEHPTSLRYAFRNFPECTVYNGAGLPALPFRTDRRPVEPAAN